MDEEGNCDSVKIVYSWPKILLNPINLFQSRIADGNMTGDSPAIGAVSEKLKFGFKVSRDATPKSELIIKVPNMLIKREYDIRVEDLETIMDDGKVVSSFALVVYVEEVDTTYTTTKKTFSLSSFYSKN